MDADWYTHKMSHSIVVGMPTSPEAMLFRGASEYMVVKEVGWSQSPTSSTASPSFARATHQIPVLLDPQ
jgi:hypothetical protein